MTLLSFKQKLYTSLDNLYPKTEVDSFFKLILEDVLNLSKIDFALNPNDLISEEKTKKIETIIDGLNQEKPIQHLIGFTEYMDLKLEVNKNVLIPRPETEELIRWIVKDNEIKPNINVLDIGTGSGCIPIAIAKELKHAEVTTVDVSIEAIDIAKKNAQVNNVNVSFVHQNILTTNALNKTYDVIVSNPPYIRNLEKVEIQKNVLEYEPHLALFVSDEDPLIFYRHIANLAKAHLKPNGALYYEINQYLGEETKDLLQTIGFKNIELKKDIFGNDRMIKATL